MAIKKELDKKIKGKSKIMLLCTFPVLLIGATIGVLFNHFNSNNKIVAKEDEKEYQYDYEYDDNWEEVLKYTAEQREKYKNINCECG